MALISPWNPNNATPFNTLSPIGCKATLKTEERKEWVGYLPDGPQLRTEGMYFGTGTRGHLDFNTAFIGLHVESTGALIRSLLEYKATVLRIQRK